MSRLPRVVVPGLAHHVTQRGNGRQRIFFCDEDYELYRATLAERARAAGLAVWAYCLMPNHVHLIVTPEDSDGLRAGIAEAHRRYAGFIHARLRRTGHLFQARFASVVMDDAHLRAAWRYVSLNPVRARLVARAEDWPWSSVRAHLAERDDGLVSVAPLTDRFGPLADLLHEGEDAAAVTALRRAESVGRPLGSAEFLAQIEAQLDRRLARAKPGPRPAERPLPAHDTAARLPF